MAHIPFDEKRVIGLHKFQLQTFCQLVLEVPSTETTNPRLQPTKLSFHPRHSSQLHRGTDGGSERSGGLPRLNINVWPKHVSHGAARGRHMAVVPPRPISMWGTFGSSDGRMGPVVIPARWNEGRPGGNLDPCPPAAARAAAMIAAMQARAAMAQRQGSEPQRRTKKPQRTSSPRALSARLAFPHSRRSAQPADPPPLTEEELDLYAFAAELDQLAPDVSDEPSLSQPAAQFAALPGPAAGATGSTEERARRVVRLSFLMA